MDYVYLYFSVSVAIIFLNVFKFSFFLMKGYDLDMNPFDNIYFLFFSIAYQTYFWSVKFNIIKEVM